MVRVLQVNYDGKDGNKWSGITSVLFNLYQNIDKDVVQFDFLTPDITSYETKRTEIEEMGGHLYDLHVGNVKNFSNLVSFVKEFEKFLKDSDYDVVHVNTGVLKFACAVAIVAKRQGFKTVVHSHNELKRSKWKSLFNTPVKWLMQRNTDLMFSCSDAAARSLFLHKDVDRGNVQILYNGIDTEKFTYDENIRTELREQLGISNNFVVGHVGRFVEQKNHTFIIDVFYELTKICEDAVLLLIGEGELEEKIKSKVNSLNIQDKVLFLGQQKNVEHFYQAMDCFIFPSIYEGLGIVLIEAQVSGLPCYMSEFIPKEADVTELVHRMSLQDDTKIWAEKIVAIDINNRYDHSQEIIKAGYSIHAVADQLEDIYIKLVEDK